MKKKLTNAFGFLREAYLRPNPSVDLEKVTSEHPVNCGEHTLSMSEYNAILHEYGVVDENGRPIPEMKQLYGSCNMLMLDRGPQLVDDEQAA